MNLKNIKLQSNKSSKITFLYVICIKAKKCKFNFIRISKTLVKHLNFKKQLINVNNLALEILVETKLRTCLSIGTCS